MKFGFLRYTPLIIMYHFLLENQEKDETRVFGSKIRFTNQKPGSLIES